MATWQQYDGLETCESKVGGAYAEFVEHLAAIWPDVDKHHHEGIRDAARTLTDRMREARQAARDQLIEERGHRR